MLQSCAAVHCEENGETDGGCDSGGEHLSRWMSGVCTMAEASLSYSADCRIGPCSEIVYTRMGLVCTLGNSDNRSFARFVISTVVCCTRYEHLRCCTL